MKVLEYISQIAKLLSNLRGTVYTSQSKMRKYQKLQDSSANNSHEGIEDISFQTEELDYEIDTDTIEDPPRAGIVIEELGFCPCDCTRQRLSKKRRCWINNKSCIFYNKNS